jgi:hypothetical protein
MAKAKRVKYTKYVTIHSLLGRKKGDVDGTFERMAELLKSSPDNGSIQFRIVDKDQPRYWNLRLDAQGCTVRSLPWRRHGCKWPGENSRRSLPLHGAR